jgi:hypothetical protein
MEKKMKAKSTRNLREARKTKPKLATHSAALEGPAGRFWTQRIEPKGAALLSETLGPCYFVIKNHGPEGIRLVAGYGDLMDLPAGKVRATYAQGTIRAENLGEKSVLIEFDFLPIFKR